MIRSDYNAYNMTIARLIKGFFTKHTFYAVLLYRMGNFCVRHHIKFLPDFLKGINLRIFACDISSNAKIGLGFRMHHTTGIVIGCDCILGDNCEVFQNVTLGENRSKTIAGQRYMPKIGNDVSIYAGACVIGPIEIGNNVQIGANSVVTKNIESNCIAAGIPAKIIKRINQDENCISD